MANSEESFVFTWKVEDFSMIPLENGQCLESPVFTADRCLKTKWEIVLFPYGLSTGEESYVSVYLIGTDFRIKTGFSFTLESTESENKIQEILEGCKFGPCGWGFPKFCCRDYLFENKQHLLPADVLTLTCRIWPSEVNGEDDPAAQDSNSLRKTCSAASRIKVHRRSFMWPISFLEINQHKEISRVQGSWLDKSPLFRVFYNFNDDSDREYSRIDIKLKNFDEEEEFYFVKGKITVISADKEYQDSYEDSHFFHVKNLEAWCFPRFIKKVNLMEKKYLVDNTLFLYFEFAFSCKSATVQHIEIPTFEPGTFRTAPSTQLNSLTSSIQELYTNGKLCDVTLSVDGKTFPCHKLVLCAQSPVFAAMFENEMKEKITGVVKIDDLDPETVARMLSFMHSGVMEGNLLFEDAIDLYQTADKYQILHLKRKCAMLILNDLSVDSVCDVLELAERHKDSFLLTNVYNFLSIHEREVFHSSNWKAFMVTFPAFSGQVMLKMLRKRSHSDNEETTSAAVGPSAKLKTKAKSAATKKNKVADIEAITSLKEPTSLQPVKKRRRTTKSTT